MKIYDCFTFFNEIDLLKFRMDYLYDHVEKFVISEANITFSGNPKPFNFLERKNEFTRWEDKIEYLQFEPDISRMIFNTPKTFDPNNTAWKIEELQRNYLASKVKSLEDDSIIILTDVDEIWNPDVIEQCQSELLSTQFRTVRLEMSFYYFYMNCKGMGSGNSFIRVPICITPSALRANESLGLNKIRFNAQNLPVIKNGGWHFSYLGGAEAVIHKIESFSHQELNNERIKEFSRINHCIEHGKDPFDRPDHTWSFIQKDDFPEDLVKIMSKYPHFTKF